MGCSGEDRLTRGETTPKPRLVVYSKRRNPAKSLRSRTDRSRKTTRRLRGKKRLHSQTKSRLQSWRRQHPQSAPTTGSSRISTNAKTARSKNDAERTQTPARSRWRPTQGNGQDSP